MFKTWSFWKSFFTIYLAIVAGTWGFLEAYTYFQDKSLRDSLGPYWMAIYILPLFFAFTFAALGSKRGETTVETLAQHNRRMMLNHVENFWVKGGLEQSLHGAALLKLGIKESPSAVDHPWAIWKEPGHETVPAGKSMLEIFKEIGAERSLLILGEPGSGKTTLLLELARQLVQRARQDETEPIPVVFLLNSWKEKQTLPDWLAEQLHILYNVPKKTALAWIHENRMLLLLDGLDEVKEGSRAKCVESINQFRTEHGFTSLVICSRAKEYSLIKPKLSMEGAISLQPLTSKQIDAYLDRFGKSLASIKQLLQKDEILRKLAETPLMLSIIALAYRDQDPSELNVSGSLEEQRKYVFDAYIQRMLEPSARTAKTPFSKQQTLHYLHWLAATMSRHNIVTYQIEAMQPSWLMNPWQDHLYMLYVTMFFGLSFGLTVGLIFVLFLGLTVAPFIVPSAVLTGLVLGLGIFALGIRRLDTGRIGAIETITMVDRLKWSWKEARSGLISGLRRMRIGGRIGGLMLALGVVLFVVSVCTDSEGLVNLIGWLFFALIVLLILGVILILTYGILGGLTGEQIEETAYPGQRLKTTFFSGFISMLIGALSVGLVVGWIVRLILGDYFGLLLGSLFGLSSGLYFGLAAGYLSLMKHYSLRLVLTHYHLLPRQLIDFLEYGVNLIFLQRVGGSYKFAHDLLMKHFAEMEV